MFIMKHCQKIIIAANNERYKSIFRSIACQVPDMEIHSIFNQSELTSDRLNEILPGWIFFPHWSAIIPKVIHENFRCVIFHMTDLPYGRGGSPLQNLIVRGHKETKISAIKCVSQLDAGEIYLQRALSLDGSAEEILQRAADIMPEMIAEIIMTNPTPIPQKGEVTPFVRRKPMDGDIAELDTIGKIHDYIRMLDGDGYPPAFIHLNKMRMEFTNSSLKDGNIEAKVKISIR